MHDSYYSDNDIDRILYQYYKANGGCLMGNPYEGQYPHCQLLLDMDTAPLSVAPVITSSSRYGYGLTCAAYTGRAYISVPPGFTSLYGITKRRRYDNKAGDQSALP